MAGAAIVGMGRPACRAADAAGMAGVGKAVMTGACKQATLGLVCGVFSPQSPGFSLQYLTLRVGMAVPVSAAMSILRMPLGAALAPCAASCSTACDCRTAAAYAQACHELGRH